MALSSATLDKTAVALAQQNAMARGGMFLSHGCRLFTVETGWESRVIMQDEGVRACETPLAFEEAVRNEDAKVIFLPVHATVTDKTIEEICHRNGMTKTIFKEVKKS